MREVGPNSFRQVMGISLVTTPITGRGEGVEVRVRRELVFMRADDAMGVGPGAAV